PYNAVALTLLSTAAPRRVFLFLHWSASRMFESIDNLLGILHSQRGRELRFEVGQHAKLVTETGAYDLSPSPLSPADIRTCVVAIIPQSARQMLTTEAAADFDYECRGIGTFRVRALRQGGAMSFIFRPPIAATAAPQPRGTGSLSQAQPPRASGPLTQT